MPKTLFKNCLRLIQRTAERFLCLTAIVCLGVAFFVGVSASSTVMGDSVDYYDDELNLKDITIYSNYGFDEDDLEALSEVEGIKDLQASYFQDVIGTSDTCSMVTRVHSYSANYTINQFELVSGRLPENEHEALAENGVDMKNYYLIGETVVLAVAEDTTNALKVDEVTIVGTVNTPVYLSMTKENSTISNRYIGTYLYVPEEAFDSEFYLEVDLTVSGARELYSFGEDYEELTEKIKDAIEEFADDEEIARTDRIKEEAMEEYNDGLEEYNDGLQEYLDGLDEYNDACEEFDTEIADARKELDDARAEIDDGYKQIDDAVKELNDAQKELDTSYAENYQTIQDGLDEIAQTRKSLLSQREELEETLASTQKQLADQGVSDLDGTISQLETTIAQLENIISEYEESLSKLKEVLAVLDELPSQKPLKDVSDELVAYAESLNLGLSGDITVGDFKYILNLMKSEMTSSWNLDAINSQITSIKETLSFLTQAKEGIAQINTGISAIDEGLALLNEKETEAEEGLKTLNNSVKTAQKQIDDGWQEITANRKKLADAEKELSAGESDLAKAIVDGKKELADAKTELDDAKRELDDAKQELADAKKEIDELEAVEWTVLDRTGHYSSVMFDGSVEQMNAIGNMFPIFFILVAALVCLTTMTRMVVEERGEIGCLRALGYSQLQCASKYLLYALTATLIGSLVGVAVGMAVFPPLIYSLWNMMYILPAIKINIPWDLVSLSVGSFVVMMLAATWYACRSDMKEVPAMLMRPKAPTLGKNTLVEKIPLIWNHLTFTWKVTVRNIFRYKKRFIMTVVGVLGCSALLVTGFGIRDSIGGMVNRQFYTILKYDGYALMDNDADAEETETAVSSVLAIAGIKAAKAGRQYSAYTYFNGEKSTSVNIEVYDNGEDIQELYLMNTMTSHKDLDLTDEGVIISQKLSENLGLDVGDLIEVENVDGDIASFKVCGICEMYIYHYVFMTEKCYEIGFGETCENRSIYFFVEDECDYEQVETALSAIEGVESFELYNETLEKFQDTVTSLNAVVWALIVSSMLLAFVVLGNLINVNISERQREIATLKVLGFRRREVSSYIYKENNVLTVIGALCGLPTGMWLHGKIMREVEMDYVIFGREIPLSSYVFAFALTVVFGYLVNLMMERKLRAITMVESLKSVE